MPSHSSLDWAARIHSMPRALRQLEGGAHALLVLPTTRRAIILARELCSVRRCLVTTTPIVEQRGWGLEPHLRTPAQIVTELAGSMELPLTVISFPDALVGEGDSFVTTRFLGSDRTFSILEGLLVLRYRPTVYGMRSGLIPGAFHLKPIAYADLLRAHDRQVALMPLMARLLSELERELVKPPGDWLAARCYELKTPSVFDRRVREELREIESLLRLALLASGDSARSFESLSPALEGVQRRLRGTGHLKHTLH